MQQNENKNIGLIIKEAREEKGLSQRKLAKLANMDCAEVSRIEAGKRQKPNVLFLKGIANALNLSLVDLMKLAGYNDIEINFGSNLTDKRSYVDYEKYIADYQRFYFEVLHEIEIRRDRDLFVKRMIEDVTENINQFSLEEITEKLKSLSSFLIPNLDKIDNSILPKYDKALNSNFNLSTNLQYDTSTGKVSKKKKK